MTLSEARRQLKIMGYNLRTKTNSDFVSATIYCNGEHIPTGIWTPQSYKRHAGLINWLNTNKRHVQRDLYPVIF